MQHILKKLAPAVKGKPSEVRNYHYGIITITCYKERKIVTI
jgi:hypothetical protein